MKYEIILWYMWLVKLFPGQFIARIRRFILPSDIDSGTLIWDGVHIDNPSNLVIGKNCSVNRGTVIHCGGGVNIASNVLIGPNVTIYSQNHNFIYKNELISNQGYSKESVIIEEDVWVASNVIILPGVRVRKGCVIGAGSVLSKDTEEFGVYVGNPAKKIKNRM